MFSFDAERFVYEVGSEALIFCPSIYLAYMQRLVLGASGIDGRSLLVGVCAGVAYDYLHKATINMDEYSKKIFAKELYKTCGYGDIDLLSLEKSGGETLSKNSFYSNLFCQKRESKRRDAPFDAFSIGFLAAAYANIFDLELGETVSMQTKIKSAKEEQNLYFVGLGRANFKLWRKRPPLAIKPPIRDRVDAWPFALETTKTFSSVVSSLSGGEEGIIQALGGSITALPASYMCGVWATFAKELTRAIGVYGERYSNDAAFEAGEARGFFLFSSLMSSEEWDMVVKERAKRPHEQISAALCIAESLGWGRIELAEASPQKNVFISYANPEEAYMAAYANDGEDLSVWSLAGSLCALCHLAYETDVSIDGGGDKEDGFLAMRRAKEGYRAVIAKSVIKGDDYLEIAVFK